MAVAIGGEYFRVRHIASLVGLEPTYPEYRSGELHYLSLFYRDKGYFSKKYKKM